MEMIEMLWSIQIYKCSPWTVHGLRPWTAFELLKCSPPTRNTVSQQSMDSPWTSSLDCRLTAFEPLKYSPPTSNAVQIQSADSPRTKFVDCPATESAAFFIASILPTCSIAVASAFVASQV